MNITRQDYRTTGLDILVDREKKKNKNSFICLKIIYSYRFYVVNLILKKEVNDGRICMIL